MSASNALDGAYRNPEPALESGVPCCPGKVEPLCCATTPDRSSDVNQVKLVNLSLRVTHRRQRLSEGTFSHLP